MSGERTFVDTNVLVYATDHSAGRKHEIASSLLEDLWSTQQGCLSIQVLQEFYVSVVRLRPEASSDAKRLISDYTTWTVHTPDTHDVMAAIETHQRSKLSFWDAMILRSAHRLECTTVLTEDLNHGQHVGSTRILNPFR